MSVPTPSPDLRPARRVPLGMVGMLALVAAVELTISARRLDFTTIWADDWRCAERAATRQAKGRDVLCLGDSLVKYGVLPKVIEEKTGLKAYNLAINAGTVPSTYFLLRHALEAGARPKAIVVDFFALMQPDLPRKSIRMYPDLATAGECLELAGLAGDLGFFNATMMGKLLPSSKCRFEIRGGIMAALDGRRSSPWPAQAHIWETWKAQDGAQPSPSHQPRPPADPILVSDISPAAWQCDKINATYVEKFLTLARSHGIPVFWVMLPASPEVQALRDLRRSDEAYDRFAKATLERHPEVVVFDARHAGYVGTVFVDPIHLDGVGAAVFTADLSAKLAAYLGAKGPAPSWVAMTPFGGGRSEGVARAGEAGKSNR
jgi:hypothetical protein